MDALINGLFLIAGVALQSILTMIQYRLRRREHQYLDYFVDASRDIEFLLAAEDLILAKAKEHGVHLTKLQVRKELREQGYEWSGRFTPGRNRERLRRLNLGKELEPIE